MLKFEEYATCDATRLAELVARREVTPAELLETAIARTEEVNPELNAVVLKHYDLARERVADGRLQGPLAGVPFLLKDLFMDLAGTTTSSGCRFLKNAVARADSTVVSRYKDAGLVIFGKTHSPEFGGSPTTESSLWGVTRNPWNLSVTPAGSSGGSAAAVAAGIVPAANGSDAGGSIRMPASVTGLFGLKPTRGRVPLGPSRFDGGGGLATLHAITRSVRDSAALLDAAAGPEPGALYASPVSTRPFVEAVREDPRPLRIALNFASTSEGTTDPECIAAANAAARQCEALGHIVEEAAPALDIELYLNARRVMWAAVLAGAVLGLQKALGRQASEADFEPTTWNLYLQGQRIRGDEVLAAREAMFMLHRQMASFMERYDVVLSPSLQRLGPRPGTIDAQQTSEVAAAEAGRFVAFSMIYNFTGQPSMSVPLFWTADELPVGAQFTGRFGDEDLLFSLAGQLERAQPWFARVPPQPFRRLGD
jgi:amidase